MIYESTFILKFENPRDGSEGETKSGKVVEGL